MANATEHLRQVAEQQYGVDAAEANALEAPALRDLLLSKIAESVAKILVYGSHN